MPIQDPLIVLAPHPPVLLILAPFIQMASPPQESVVLGNFVLKQVLDEVGHQVRGGLVMGGLHVSHIAHLGGALAGVLLVALLQRLPQPKDE